MPQDIYHYFIYAIIFITRCHYFVTIFIFAFIIFRCHFRFLHYYAYVIFHITMSYY